MLPENDDLEFPALACVSPAFRGWGDFQGVGKQWHPVEWTRSSGAITPGVLTWSAALREERDETGPHHRIHIIKTLQSPRKVPVSV